MEVIENVSSPMYIPLLSHWRDGNVSDRYVDKLTPQILGQYGIELLGENTKLFFDIDGKGKELMSLTYDFKTHLDQLLESGKRKFIYCYSKPEDMEEASRRKDYRKLSFHIIFEDKAIHRLSFKPDQEEDTLKWLLGNFYDTLRPCVDKGVYDKNRKIRLPCYCNDEKPVELMPCDSTINLTRFAINLPPGIYKIQKPVEEEKVYDEKQEEEPITNERIKKMSDMLSMVKKERFQTWNEWFKLLCLMRGNRLSKDLFLQMSKDSGYKNYSQDGCLEEWYKTKEERRYGYPTIHKWLEEDGVDWKILFCKKREGIVADLLKSMNECGGKLTDLAIAEIFYKYYNTSLYWTQAGWIHYNETRGWETGSNNDIVYPLMKLLGDAFYRFAQTLKAADNEDEGEFKKRKKSILSQAERLASYSFCEKVIKTSQTLFKNDNIIEKFDAKPHWFCFSDFKAIDMKTGKVIDVTKDDYIMTTCGYPLPQRNPEKIKEATEFINSLVENKNYKSFMSMIAANFYGDPNLNQKLFVHTGTGGNGKSLLGVLLMYTLSGYAGILPIEQLTRESKGRDDANSALFAMRGKRYAQAVEPEDSKDTTLKIARIKELTGEDSVMVRELHKTAIKMKISFTLNIFCNEKPRMSKSDAAIERRLVVFPYVYEFVDFPDPEDPYQKQKDENKAQMIKSDKAFRDGFLYMCLDYWRECHGKFIPTEDVVKANAEYLLENNLVAPWFSAKYKCSEENHIRQKELLEIYKKDTSTILTANSFNKYLQQLGVKIQIDKSNGNKIFVELK
jgi:phage/plasmid-associated DNA primase